MELRFDHPAWFALVLLAIPFGWMAVRWFASMSRARRWSAAVLRALLIALVASLLAGANTQRTTDKLATIVVLDVSGSVRQFVEAQRQPDGTMLEPVAQLRQWLASAIEDRGPDDLVGVVLFDGQSVAVASPSSADPTARSFEITPTEGSDLASALRFASRLIPPDAAGRVVLASDGNETTGDAIAAAEELAGGTRAGRLRVDVLPLSYRVERETMIERVDAPPRAAGEASIAVRVTLRSTDGSRGTIRLRREGEELDINGSEPGSGRRIEVPPGLSTFVVEVPLPEGRLHRFEAIYEPDLTGGSFAGDGLASNNRGEAFTLTPGRGAVLVVDWVGQGAPTPAGRTLAGALEEAGAAVEVIGPDAFPDSPLGLQSYDLIILQSVPADELSRSQQALLDSFVRELGGGLVMVGGYDSFGAGGWKGTAVEPILPVKLDLPERAVVPEVAVAFVLDSSGSMSASAGGSVKNKQQIANEAAALAVLTLDEKDLVSVIRFSSDASVVVPLGPNEDPRQTGMRIASIAPGGGTNIPLALEVAERELGRTQAKSRHVILLTDGRSQDSERLPDIARRFREKGITLTAIGVGDADVEMLDQIAGLGGGRFYHVINPNSLPRVFVRAVRVVRKPMIREQPFTPVLAQPSPMTDGLGQPPPLGGLVLTQRRDEPTITTAMTTPLGEPVLAHWPVELGRVVAFTSDAHGNWSRAWLAWPGYRRLWTNILRLAARAEGQSQYELFTEIRDGQMRVRLEAFDGRGGTLDLLDVPASIYAPAGERLETRLTQVGPGAYEATVPAADSGSYIAIIKPSLGGTRLSPVVGGATAPIGPEYRALSSNVSLLADIAERTGGRVLDLQDPGAIDLFDRTGVEPRRALVPAWRPLLFITLIVLLLDIATRRIAWDRLLSAEYGARSRAEAREERARAKGVARSMQGLRAASGKLRGQSTPAAPISEAEAAAIARKEAERQRAARLDAVRTARARTREQAKPDAGRPQPPPAPGAASPAPPVGTKPERREKKPEPHKTKPTGAELPTPPGEAKEESGLLAAKRRARQRFEEDA